MTILTYDEVCQRTGWSRRWTQKLIKRGDLPRLPTGRRLANGHREFGIPAEAVEAYLRGDRPSACKAQGPSEIPSAVAPLPNSTRRGSARGGRCRPRADGAPPDGTNLAAPRIPSEVEGQTRQLALFEPGPARPDHLPEHIPITRDGLPDLVALRQMGLGSQADAYEHSFRAVSRLQAALHGVEYGQILATHHQVAEEFGISESTLRNWHRALKKWGWAGLMRAHGKSRGRRPSIPDKLQKQILDAFAYQGEYSVAQIYERVVRPYIRTDGRQLPHPETIRRFIRQSVLPVIKSASRHGSRAYQEDHEPRVLRDLESAGVNGWWVSDHRLADTMVLVPDGKGTGWPSKVRSEPCTCGSGERRRDCCSVRRPWWTVTVDVCSAAIVGWRFSLTPTASTVCHMLHSAIMHFGLPGHWLRDHGKEFNARRLDGPTVKLCTPAEADLAGRRRWPAVVPPEVERSTMWDQLGVLVVSARPYSPWAKYIESIFSAFSRRYENLLPGWTGSSASRKPEKLKAELLRGELLTIDEYRSRISAMINEWNAEHRVGKRRQVPLAYYADYRPRIPDPQTLTFLLQDPRRKTVRGHRLELDGHIYESEQLSIYSGVRADIRWDPGEPAWIWVYPGDGRCIAVPECAPGKYGEWGGAVQRAMRARRAQKESIREWAAPIKGCCPPDGMDPFGAHRAVHERVRLAADTPAGELPLAIEAAQEDAAEKPDSHLTPYQVARREHLRRLAE